MPNLIALVLSNWKLIIIILAFAVSNAWSLNHGMNIVEAEQEAALSLQRENNLRINTEVSDDLSKKYTALRKRYDDLIRVRQASSVSNTNTSGRDNARPTANGLHGDVGETVGYPLMLQADLQTQQLIACQNWIREISK